MRSMGGFPTTLPAPLRFALVSAATLAATPLLAWALNAFGPNGALAAFLAAWVVMAWVAVTGQLVHLMLPATYYDLRSWEQDGRAYERAGIRVFKYLVRRGPLTILSRTLHLPQHPSEEDVHHVESEMRKAEAGHLLAFALTLLLGCLCLLAGWRTTAIWATVFNVPLNGYPIMLQRYNRGRLGHPHDRRSLRPRNKG